MFDFQVKNCLALVFTLFSVICNGEPNYSWDRGHSSTSPSQYDFVIVGGGTAGCTLASRLTENGKHSVLLLETGGYPPDFLEVPGFALRNMFDTSVTFQYRSVPQRNAALSLDNGVIPTPVGRVLGGSSQINYSAFNRGSPYDYDNWANITGDPSWAYSQMLKYFRKSEQYLGQFPSKIQHGHKGPIPVSSQTFAPGREAWKEAGLELGFQYRDANGPQQISFTPMESSRIFGRRHSSFRGYIEPILSSRVNLRILVNAHATKVVFDEKTRSAIGVRYTSNGTESVVFANKEVILSAGSFGSSTLLMKSGIGPRSVLKSSGIRQILELPVGENFQDHPVVPFYIVLNNKSLSYDPKTDLNPENFQLWKKYGTGPYSTVIGYSGQSFQSSSLAKAEGQGHWPDIQIALASTTDLLPPFQSNYIAPWETTIRLNLFLGRAASRGTVKLTSNGDPLIDYNHLGEQRDEDILLDGVKAILKIFIETETYKKYGARLFKEPLPGCAHLPYPSDSYWRCYTHHITETGYHFSGTCSINSVVDSKLKVYGVQKLRIVDASIMPYVTNSNLHAAVYGIAEKMADVILRDNNL